MTAERVPGGFRVRLRYGRDAAGKPQRDRFLIVLPHTPEGEIHAADRERRMQVTAALLAKLRSPGARGHLVEMGKLAADERAFRALERAVEKLAAEAAVSPPADDSGPVTFRDVADLWTSGKARALYPDHVREKIERKRKNDAQMLSVFLPALGHRAMADITDQDIQVAKRAIPSALDPNTRIVYLKRLRSVFRLAAGPLNLITAVPKEADTLPLARKRSLFWFLYPEEEAQLLGCVKIPLVFRVLYGWLSRNGSRIGETLMLDHAHLDLDRGRVHLEAEWTKTRRSRYWDLEPDVVAAMRIFRVLGGEPKPGTRVFRAAYRETMSDVTVRERFKRDLLLAGVDRAELHRPSPGSKALRVHDLRGGFCTLARRRGMTANWIMDRSGHESLGQLEQYTRAARHADEQGLPKWWAPMDQAIPELRFASRLGQGWASTARPSGKQATSARGSASIEESLTEADPAKTPTKTGVPAAETPLSPTSGPAGFQGVGQPGPGQGEVSGPADTAHTDPVEKALAFALEAATRDGRYDVVLAVTAELRERRLQRTAPQVTSLEQARKKRDQEGGK